MGMSRVAWPDPIAPFQDLPDFLAKPILDVSRSPVATLGCDSSWNGGQGERHKLMKIERVESADVETPSGKGAKDENFPVGSLLLHARFRPHIRIFYAFARAIDDIADNPDLSPAEKIARLNGFDQAVRGLHLTDPAFRKAHDVRQSLAVMQVTERHCRDLIRAFKQDATKLNYADWDELISYCDLSAAPVGRYLIDLHDEPATAYPISDALCNALQILNHLQDCGHDFRELDRVYLPEEWMADAGVDRRELGGNRSTRALRGVLDRCLRATDKLLIVADRLPAVLSGFRFSMEAAVIVAIARRLARELRKRDPLAERVTLNRAQVAACCLHGIAHAVLLRVPGRTARLGRQQSSPVTGIHGSQEGRPATCSRTSELRTGTYSACEK